MNRALIPSAADMIFFVAAPIKAVHGAVKLTQSDGDLAAHVRMGQVILSTRHIPAHSLASYTAPADALIAHAWLSEVFFATLYSMGGVALLAIFTAIVIGCTHAGVALFLRARGVDPRWVLLAALASLALSLSHWLARPHMFSIAGAFATIVLLASPRRHALAFFALFAIWTNLHGGWLFGLLLVTAWGAGELAEYALTREPSWLASFMRTLFCFAAAALATLLNPYGIVLHREVLSAVTSESLAGGISEYMAPNFQELAALPFLIGLLVTVTIFALVPKRMRLDHLGIVVLSLATSLQSFRNIALFGVTAWPLIALYAWEGWPARGKAFPFFREFARLDSFARPALWAAPVAALLFAMGLNRGAVAGVAVVDAGFDHATFPVAALDSIRGAGDPGRTFHPWVWGGYVMLAAPGTRLHVDPLEFSAQTMASYTTISELRPGWKEELARWKVSTVLAKPRSLLAAALEKEPDWKMLYADRTAVVFRFHVPGS